jgi:integrase
MGRQKHLRKVGKTFFVRMAIPADVRHAFNGKVEFVASTKKQDEWEANAVAGNILLDWDRQIKDARQAVQRPVQDEAARLASEYRRYRGQPLDDTQAAVILDVVGFVMGRVGGLDTIQVRDALRQSSSLTDTFQTLPVKVETAFNEITGKATPFLTCLDDWQRVATEKGKTMKQMLSTLHKFGAVVKEPMETLSGKHVQKWLDDMTNEKTGGPADAKTKQRKLSDIRPYWKHLQNYEHVPSDKNPFENRTVANRETEAEAQERERIAYKVSEVPALWQRAMVEGDTALADLIQLAAYSGARLGELMNLTTSSIVMEDGIACIHIVIGKTRTARRIFPIHPAITALMERLKTDAQADGWLIPCGAKHRPDTMSKRFGRLKTDMGYDEHYTFHCLRHTVIEAFRNIHCPLEIRNRIVGHEDSKETVNTGAGYGGLSAQSKLEWLKKAIQYPDTAKTD